MHDLPDSVLRRNRIRQIREKLGGGRRNFYSLTAVERTSINRQARELYDAGVTEEVAIQNERRRADGFVYLVTNRAWPGCVKVGRAFNPATRLAAFNTADPNRAYRLVAARYFKDCETSEVEIHDHLNPHRVGGEWFRVSARAAVEILESL